MPSASKGRYQSRLFNFFHKQSRRFGEGFGRSLRQLQVASTWSIEALSKSIYLLLQKSIDSAGTQLPAAETGDALLQLQPSSDSAIARVLENVQTRYINSSAVETKIVEDASGSLSNLPNLQDVRLSRRDSQPSLQDVRLSRRDSQLSASRKIQGVASQLYSQNLVLVTSENEILDILTPSQQQALENKIISEIANYWRSWRLFQDKQETKSLSTNSFLKRLSPDNAQATKALPSENVAVKREYNYLQINPDKLASLDTKIAQLETNALAPVSQAQIVVRQRSGELIKVAKARLDRFLYRKTEVTVSGDRGSIAEGNLQNLQTPSKTQALISAALSYFYSEPKTDPKIQQAPPQRHLAPTKPNLTKPNSQLQRQSQEDWLTLDDLFNNQYPQLKPNRASKVETAEKQLYKAKVEDSSKKLFGRFQIPFWRTSQLKEKAGLQNLPEGVLQDRQDSYITRSSAKDYRLKNRRDAQSAEKRSKEVSEILEREESKPRQQDANNTAKAKASRISEKIIVNSGELSSQSNGEIVSNKFPESTQIEAKPEWIETKAEMVGYQKHPLEQVLAWIDNTMLKIEEAFMNLANSLQKLWRK